MKKTQILFNAVAGLMLTAGVIAGCGEGPNGQPRDPFSPSVSDITQPTTNPSSSSSSTTAVSTSSSPTQNISGATTSTSGAASGATFIGG
ncbi:MAG: hypothetical protein HYT28_01510 [Parcubacteria group bacterium]|nr:hypothetical protein [Parcubacteria group bacterium]